MCCLNISESAMHTAQQHSAETARLHYQMDVRTLLCIILCINFSSLFLFIAYGREPDESRRISSWSFWRNGSLTICVEPWNRAPRRIHPSEVPDRLVSFFLTTTLLSYHWNSQSYRSPAELKWLIEWGKAWKKGNPTTQYDWRACRRAIEADPSVMRLFLPDHLCRNLLSEAHKRCVAKLKC